MMLPLISQLNKASPKAQSVMHYRGVRKTWPGQTTANLDNGLH